MVPYELFRQTLDGAGIDAVEVRAGNLRAIVLPGLGGRVFVRHGESILHRFDHASVRRPSTELGVYNNYGGLNIWPAPEGGAFGWTYTPQGVWHVQAGVNEVPFTVVERRDAVIRIRKETRITNRKGVPLDVTMDRTISIRPAPFAPGLEGCSVTVQDAFHCSPRPDALIAPWTLEQFDAVLEHAYEVLEDCEILILHLRKDKRF